jgi:hypothetical protein
MYYDYPTEKEAYDYKNEYMFGDNMLVAPVISPGVNGLSSVKVWLPKGNWYEWFTGAMLEGGKVYERQFLLDEYPVYVKAGAIIPMYPKVKNLKSQIDELIVSVFPGGNFETKVYEDNGDDKYYKDQFAFTKIKSEVETDGASTTLSMTIGKREGSYKDMLSERSYNIKLHGSLPPASVEVNGKDYKFSLDKLPGIWNYDFSLDNMPGIWNYDADKLCVSIRIPRTSCSKEITIVVKYKPDDMKYKNVLNGMISKMKKVDIAGQFIRKQEIDDNTLETLRKTEQTSTRIYYKPSSIIDELKGFEINCRKLIDDISKSSFNKEVKDVFLNYFK